MDRRLEDTIRARPGEFEWAATSVAHDNERRTPKKKLTHLRFLCEICGQEVTTHIGSAEAVARRFDQHKGCKPKEEWPERPGPMPRVSPKEHAAKRERLRRQLEGE